VCPVDYLQDFSASSLRSRMAIPWLTVTSVCVSGSFTAALTFHSVAKQGESPAVTRPGC